MFHRLSNSHRFLSPGDPLRELSTRGKHVDQPDPRLNRGQIRFAKTLTNQLALDGLDVALETISCTRVVAQTEIGDSQTEIRRDLKAEIPTGLGDGKGVMTGLDNAVRLA